MTSSPTALLLGAGFSIPFGIPSTEDLTELITSEEIKFVKTTCGDYYTEKEKEEEWRRKNPHKIDLDGGEAEAYHNIIRFLYTREKDQLVRKINFEDIYSLLYSLAYPSQSACYQRYRDGFIEYLDKLSDKEKTKLKISWPKQDLLKELREPDPYITTMKMLKCIIAKELDKHSGVDVTLLKSKFWDHLFKSEKINIFSLNHDLIIEQILEHKSKDFQDGFELKNGFQEFTDNFPDNNKINFLKLHGSINWFNVSGSGRNFYVNNKNTRIESMTRMYSNLLENRQEPLFINGRAFLTGTQNKYEEYLIDIYSDLKWHYKRLLKDTEKLIVIGYSFGDYGVTTEIRNWMNKKMNAKLIIIDPNANTLLETGFLVPRLKEAFPERITAINKRFQDLKETDYKSIFNT